jgi:hypothetical protein
MPLFSNEINKNHVGSPKYMERVPNFGRLEKCLRKNKTKTVCL